MIVLLIKSFYVGLIDSLVSGQTNAAISNLVITGVAIVVFWTWPPPPRWIEADIEDDPAIVDKAAMMSMPPMVTAAVPIVVPARGMLREDVVSPVPTKGVVAVLNAVSDALRIRDRAISCI